MKHDQIPAERRTFLRLALALGAATAVRMIAADPAGTPTRPGGEPPAPAAGPPARAQAGPGSYRLRPMTSGTPPRFRP
ncbi:polysaccharide deacetylase family protein, partial [Streptomyces sp. JAC25]